MSAPKVFSATSAEIMALVAAYYAKDGNGAGGSLHIVLDDGNVDDDNVRFCLEQARDAGDLDGVRIAELLLERGRSTRRRIAEGWSE